ncbi:MAG: GNAT family N-acetyltransferase [bacterium]|nr:GNAT family N-acetyltransferase [bacterium]
MDKGRWLTGDDDVARMQEFNGRAVASAGWAGYIHTGDIVHRLFSGCRQFEPSRIVHLWEDESGIAAWVMLQPKHLGFDLQIRPGLRGGSLETNLVAWCEQALLNVLQETNKQVDEIVIDAFADDPGRVASVESLGFTRGGEPYFVTTRPTADPIDAPLPEGYTLRTVRGPEEAEAVGALHGASFGSTWNPGEYATLMGTFGYSPDREWLVVAPDGSLAGFTETWHDPISSTGLFEPVGTHPDHRRRGVGRALMAAGLRDMASAGLATGMVCFEGDNAGSRALYLGSGFEIAHEIIDYTKAVSSSE